MYLFSGSWASWGLFCSGIAICLLAWRTPSLFCRCREGTAGRRRTRATNSQSAQKCRKEGSERAGNNVQATKLHRRVAVRPKAERSGSTGLERYASGARHLCANFNSQAGGSNLVLIFLDSLPKQASALFKPSPHEITVMGVFPAHRIAKSGSCLSKALQFESWISCSETSIADWSRTQTSRRWRGWLKTDSLHREQAIANKQKESYEHQSLRNLSYRVWPLGVFPFFVIAYDTLHCSGKNCSCR